MEKEEQPKPKEKTGSVGSTSKSSSPARSSPASMTKKTNLKPESNATRTSDTNKNTTTSGSKTSAGTLLKSFFIIILLILVLAGTGYLMWPSWKIYLAERFSIFDEYPKIASLTNRIDKLEGNVSSQHQQDKIILNLEQDRDKLSQSLAGFLRRIETLEQSMSAVKKMAKTAANAEEVAQARRSLKALNDRLKRIEAGSQMGKPVDPNLVSRLKKLEEQQSANQSISERISALEGSDIKSKEKLKDTIQALKRSESTIESLGSRLTIIEEHPGGSNATAPLAVILAVSELRNAVQNGDVFSKELDALRTISGPDPAVQATLMALEKHSTKGIRTLPKLQDTFRKLANSIVDIDKNNPDPGWVHQALQQITTLVRFRRIDGGGNSQSTEAIVAQAEKHLAAGDLEAAVISVEQLTGSAKTTAASWLASAKARQGAEQVLTSLHKHALSLFSMAKG